MPNIFDYISWRGDLSFSQDKVNKIDSLIFARFSYLPLDGLIMENEKVVLEELYKRFENSDAKNKILWPGDDKLFECLANSKRYKNIVVSNYVNNIEEKDQKQFCAVTLKLPNGIVVISFMGTDNSLIGWKEDFNLSFSSNVPSQIDALNYLNMVGKKYKWNKIITVGHSKGGNFAMYSGAFAKDKIKKRILNIYNFDGPGFREDIANSKQYLSILDKIQTYIPQDSIIGRLLEHKEKTFVINSCEKFVMQHDLYSWQLKQKDFVYEDNVTAQSILIDNTIRDWIIDIDDKTRQEVIDVIYNILLSTNEKTFKELRSNFIPNAKTMIKSYSNLDSKTKENIIKCVKSLASATKNNLISKPLNEMEIRKARSQ